MMRVAAWLLRFSAGGRRPADAGVHSSDADRRLQELQAAVQRWKARYTEAAARARELRNRGRASAQRLRRLRVKLGAAAHEIPSPSVSRALLPHRARTFAARVRHVPPDAREQALLAASAAYCRASADLPESLASRAHRMDLQGLTWWVPLKRPGRGLPERWVRKQRFPYRVIMQTREVTPGGIMLDIGANIGRMSIPRVLLGDSIAAYCAEPEPLNYACLVRNVCDNGLRGFVLPDQVAIGDVDGTVTLLRTASYTGHHVVTRETGPAPCEPSLIEVPSVTLDTWVARLRIDLDAVTFIKVDVEGYEPRVLAGAAGVLARRHIAWQLELNPRRLRGAGDDLSTLAGLLASHFTHFIDLRRSAAGRRVRKTSELLQLVAELEASGENADVLVYTHG